MGQILPENNTQSVPFGRGFLGVTPLLISFEDETPFHAVANTKGKFALTLSARRR
jgi:hypothetical protein